MVCSVNNTNGLIGPHEGIEFELMMEKAKPLAFTNNKKVINAFMPYIDAGKFVYEKILACHHNMIFWAIATPKEAWRIKALADTYTNCRNKNRMDNDDHIYIGKLLGYTNEEITAFLARD